MPPPPLSRRRIPPQRRFFLGLRLFRALRSIRLRGAAISRFALNTPRLSAIGSRQYASCRPIAGWRYGLWLRLFRALRSIRLRGAAISRLSPDISHQCPIFLTLRGSKTNHYFDAAHCNIESALQRPSTHSKKICLSTELSNFIQHILRSIFFSFSIFP